MKRILLGLALLIGAPFQAFGMEMPSKPTINKSLLDNDHDSFFKIIEDSESIESAEFLDLLFNVRVQKVHPYLWVICGHRILTECPLLSPEKTKQDSLDQEEPKALTLTELALNSCIKNKKLIFDENCISGTIAKKVGYIKKTGEEVVCNQKITLPDYLSRKAIPALLSHEYEVIAKHLQWHFAKFGSLQYCLDIVDNLPVGIEIKIIKILKNLLDKKDMDEIHYAVQGKETDFSKKPYSQLFVMLLKSTVKKQFENARKYASLCSNYPSLTKECITKIQLYLTQIPFQSDEEKREWREMPNCMLGILNASRRFKANQSNDDQEKEIEERRKEIKDCCAKIVLKEVFGFIVDIQEKYHARESEPSPLQLIKDSFLRRNL